jgi:hypothetical protein
MSRGEIESRMRFVPDASSSVVQGRAAGSTSPATASSQSHIGFRGFGRVMRAMRFEVFGDPSVLELAEVPAPAADERTAVVRVMAGSNPNSAHSWWHAQKPGQCLHRCPGRARRAMAHGLMAIHASRGRARVRGRPFLPHPHAGFSAPGIELRCCSKTREQ